MSEEWKWGWEAIGALGNWFAGVVTAFGVYAALRRPQPKVKVKAKIQEIIYKETPRGKFGLWVKNVHTLPVTIEEIGIIIRKPWFQNFTWNKLTGKYFTWGKQYHSLSQFKVVEDESQKRSMEHRIIPVKLPFRLDQEESTPELSIDFVRLANLL